jgi:hypothetical protein
MIGSLRRPVRGAAIHAVLDGTDSPFSTPPRD